MKRPTRLMAALLVTGLLSFALAARADSEGKEYICPPCGAPCDTTIFHAPGVCPACGMTLVERAAAAAAAAKEPPRKKVAIVVFNAAEILDFTGPYEMFGAAGCDVYLVAETKDPVTTAMGMTVVPKYTFQDAPQPDVLLIPGGGVKAAAQDQAVLDYIRRTTEHTQTTMSVCNGAFILANTGLLDGLRATTTNGNIPRMSTAYPKIQVVRDERVVDNGKLVTTAGLSAGMDGALHVIANLFGTGYAQEVALSEEYDWQAGKGYARAALADNQIPQVDLQQLGKWDVVRTEGDTKHWDLVLRGEPNAPAELTARLEQELEKGHWTKLSSAKSGATGGISSWRFTGIDGKPWTGSLKVEAADATGRHFLASLSIARTS